MLGDWEDNKFALGVEQAFAIACIIPDRLIIGQTSSAGLLSGEACLVTSAADATPSCFVIDINGLGRDGVARVPFTLPVTLSTGAYNLDVLVNTEPMLKSPRQVTFHIDTPPLLNEEVNT